MARSRQTVIAAEMVGNVLEVGVGVGDAVAEGDHVVLLESMKMEIPVVAEAPGTVVEVRVSPGDVVQEGDGPHHAVLTAEPPARREAWRRGRDSNPRWVSPRPLSRRFR